MRALPADCNDPGGTLMNENILRAAGEKGDTDARELIPLTAQEVHLLLLLTRRAAEEQSFLLHWPHWRRRHQIQANVAGDGEQSSAPPALRGPGLRQGLRPQRRAQVGGIYKDLRRARHNQAELAGKGVENSVENSKYMAAEESG